MELASPATRASTDPLARWAERYVRLDGRPFSFAGHAYLRALYDDTTPHVVLCKATQIGGTVWALLRAFRACLEGLNVGYLFPTKTDVLDFSRSRVAPLIAGNEFLRRAVTDTDTAGLKRIGSGFLYLRGMQSQVSLKSIPIDMLIFDELDETTPEAKALARERLAHSDYRRIVELSNPSLPDYGVDEAFQASDQRHWTIRCPSCSRWTALDKEFPTKLGQEVPIIRPRQDGSFYRACPDCAAELDLETGEWVADFPTRPIHGYRISQLISSKVDPGEILHEYRTTRFPSRFYNLKIGIPWADLERRLDASFVLAQCTEAPMAMKPDWRPCSMGVDTGRDLHVVIVQPEGDGHEFHRLVHLEVCHTFDDLDGLLKRFDVDRCVIDGLPETHATRAFAARHPGVAFMSFFNEHQRGEAKWDYDSRTVQVNRTEALDASRMAVRERHVILPRRVPIVEVFAEHLAANAKVLEEDAETGAKRFKYIRTAPDHFSLAFTYTWMAATHMGGHRGFMEYIRQEARKARGE